MRFRKRGAVLLLALAMAALAITFYLSFGHLAVYTFSKANNISVSYRDMKTSLDRFVFRGLRAVDSRSGVGILSEYAEIKAKWNELLSPEKEIGFHFHSVRFIKKEAERTGAYNTLSEVVAIPFNSRWAYRDIRGMAHLYKERMEVKSFDAASDEIKLSFSGTLYRDYKIESEITIYFPRALADEIPEELSKVLLTEERDGWKSLSARLSGDCKSPSINISSKLFRLNIKTISKE